MISKLKTLSKLKMAGKLRYWRGTIEIPEDELHAICDEIQAEHEQAITAMGIGECEIERKIVHNYGGEGSDTYEFVLSCGHSVEWLDDEPPRHCPTCGKVVGHHTGQGGRTMADKSSSDNVKICENLLWGFVGALDVAEATDADKEPIVSEYARHIVAMATPGNSKVTENSIDKWLREFQLAHGELTSIGPDELEDLACALHDDIPLGYEASMRLAHWLLRATLERERHVSGGGRINDCRVPEVQGYDVARLRIEFQDGETPWMYPIALKGRSIQGVFVNGERYELVRECELEYHETGWVSCRICGTSWPNDRPHVYRRCPYCGAKVVKR